MRPVYSFKRRFVNECTVIYCKADMTSKGATLGVVFGLGPSFVAGTMLARPPAGLYRRRD